MKMIIKLFTSIYLTSKFWLFLLLVAICSIFAIQRVDAARSNTIPKYGFLSGVTAYANIGSEQISGSSNGKCNITSYTSPATTINVIGWTWWQCERWAGSTLVQHIYTPGSAPSGTSHSDGFTWLNAFTGGVDKLKAHGVHDFNHNGSNPSPWRPYNVNIYP